MTFTGVQWKFNSEPKQNKFLKQADEFSHQPVFFTS